MPSNSTEYMQAYYVLNKDKIKQQVKARSARNIHCESCNKDIKLSSYKLHLNTNLHKGNETKNKKNNEIANV